VSLSFDGMAREAALALLLLCCSGLAHRQRASHDLTRRVAAEVGSATTTHGRFGTFLTGSDVCTKSSEPRAVVLLRGVNSRRTGVLRRKGRASRADRLQWQEASARPSIGYFAIVPGSGRAMTHHLRTLP